MYKYHYNGLTGEVVTQDDYVYEDCRMEANRAVQRYPLAIVYCRSSTDIANAILWARKNCLPVRIRSGGHHTEGYSTGNDALVIDLGRMKKLGLNEAENTLTAESGVTMREVYDAAAPLGCPFPGACFPSLGVLPYTLGGGIGHSSRLLGLACDSLLELEIVNYKGELLTAKPHCNQDLFWAAAGAGGGSFGVVVSMKFRLPEKAGRLSYISFAAEDVSQSAQSSFLARWQDFLPGLDWRMTLQASLNYSKGSGLGINGQGLFYGSAEEAENILSSFGDMPELNIRTEETDLAGAMERACGACMQPQFYKAAGRFVYSYFGPGERSGIAGLLKTVPEGCSRAEIGLYAMGGAVEKVRNSATAFYYRDAKYLMKTGVEWEERRFTPGTEEWLSQAYKAVKSLTYGSYVNFPYAGTSDYTSAYYGQNAYRLSRTKQIYDPYNIFTFPQSIKPI